MTLTPSLLITINRIPQGPNREVYESET